MGWGDFPFESFNYPNVFINLTSCPREFYDLSLSSLALWWQFDELGQAITFSV